MKKNLAFMLRHLFLLASVGLLFSSCVLLSKVSNPIMTIHKGQTQEEVFQLLGKPESRSFDELSEKWVYSYLYLDKMDVYVITFRDNHVVRLENFVNTSPSSVGRVSRDEYEDEACTHEAITNRRHRVEPFERQFRHDQPCQNYLMSREEFNQFMKEGLSACDWDKERNEMLRAVSQTRLFSCRQVASILKHFDFDSNRKQALSIIAPAIYDRERYFLLRSSFDFLDAEDIWQIILASKPHRHAPQPHRRCLITQDEFVSFLKEDYSLCRQDRNRIELLKIFSQGRMLRCKDLAQLLHYFDFESNRKHALSILAPCIYDREHCGLLAEEFPLCSLNEILRIINSSTRH